MLFILVANTAKAFGAFNIGRSTPVGIYRFVPEGGDPDSFGFILASEPSCTDWFMTNKLDRTTEEDGGIRLYYIFPS